MTIYTCPRCDFSTTNRTTMCCHVNRRFPCEATVNDVPIDELKKEYNKPKPAIAECPTCGKTFSSRVGFSGHKCKLIKINPETINPIESSLSAEESLDLKTHIKHLYKIVLNLQTQIKTLNDRRYPIRVHVKAERADAEPPLLQHDETIYNIDL